MGKYRCPGCDYTYDEQQGDTHEGYPPGTLFTSLPEEFTCPDCAVRYKEDFLKIEE
jgi:rubredoxin